MNARPVRILGGGLAGLSLGAALARRGIPVTVTEAFDYPRHRVCGEFIAGLDEATRTELDLGRVLSGGRLLEEVSWYRAGVRLGAHRLPRPAFGVSRFVLDQRLAQGFEDAGGILKVNTRAPLDTAREGEVLAGGRKSTRAGWVGIKAHVEGLPLACDLEVHLGKSSYVGACQVSPGVANVCGLFHREHLEGGKGTAWFLDQLERSGFSVLVSRIQRGRVREETICSVAGLGFEEDAPEDGKFRLGDAIGAIPPFTGHGMALAFQSAAAALPPLVEWSCGQISWSEAMHAARLDFRRRARSCFRMARLLHPWLLSTPRQHVFAVAQRSGVLPLNYLTRLVHN